MKTLARVPSTQVQEIGDRLYAYVTGTGDWAESNSGFAVGTDESTLLVDTLIDVRSTRRMLDEVGAVDPAIRRIDTLVNTHADGDHTWGNQLAEGAEILTSSHAAAGFAHFNPAAYQNLGSPAAQDFFDEATGNRVDLSAVTLTRPARTFDGEYELVLGDRRVTLIDVGPAHSGGDVVIHFPDDNVVFAGDLVFNGVVPMFWGDAPIERWVAACDRILDLKPDVVVPGHGPVSDTRAVRAMRSYLTDLSAKARACFDAGMTAQEAAHEIDGGDYADWLARERVICNVVNVYREFDDASEPVGAREVFRLMGEWYFAEKANASTATAR